MNRVLSVLVLLPAILFIVMGVRWLVAPAGIAPEFGLEPFNIDSTIIGAKAGEKIYEELMTEEETARAIELERYFVVLPAFRGVYEQIQFEYPNEIRRGADRPYVSRTEPAMSVESIRGWLRESGLARKCVEAATMA